MDNPELRGRVLDETGTVTSARIMLEAADGRWLLSLVGTNLGNEAVLNNSQPFFSNIGYLGSPRRIWLQGSWRFGD